jgi:hypothetical protein
MIAHNSQTSGLVDDRQRFARDRFEDRHLSEIPASNLQQLTDTDQAGIDVLQVQRNRREAVGTADLSVGERIIETEFRGLAKKYHPDLSGTDLKGMKQITAAREAMVELVREGRR